MACERGHTCKLPYNKFSYPRLLTHQAQTCHPSSQPENSVNQGAKTLTQVGAEQRMASLKAVLSDLIFVLLANQGLGCYNPIYQGKRGALEPTCPGCTMNLLGGGGGVSILQYHRLSHLWFAQVFQLLCFPFWLPATWHFPY